MQELFDIVVTVDLVRGAEADVAVAISGSGILPPNSPPEF